MIKHLKVKEVTADATVGFPSAPTTGTIFGCFHAVKGMLAPISCLSLNLTPDFDRTILDGRFSCSIEVRYPLVLAFRLFQIGMRRPVRQALFSDKVEP